MLEHPYRKKTKRAITYVAILLMVVFWSLFFYDGLQVGNDRPKKFLTQTVGWLVDKMFQDPRGLVLTSLPVLAWQDTPEEMENPIAAIQSWIAGITHINLSPEDTLRSEIPLLAQMEPPGSAVITVLPDSERKELPGTEQAEVKDILVGIYNTHTGETYTLTDGKDRLTGKRGGVEKVAQRIQQDLQEKHAIPVDRSDKVHDQRYNSSYLESEKTAKAMVEQHPHMLAMLDIHRDGGRSRKDCLVEVKGQKVAPILIVIGSDARLPFPNWKKNYQFACRLAEKMDALFPGLCEGVRVKEGRYNQFLHPGAILVEVGSDNNSLEEALKSSDMLSDALAELLKEEMKAKTTNKAAEDLPEEAQEEGSIQSKPEANTEQKPASTNPSQKGKNAPKQLEENVY